MNNILSLMATDTKIELVDNGTGDDLANDVSTIISNIVLVLGLVAVVVIIIGGLLYMTSAGDSNKVKKAKDTILYGIIGLVICALAYAIVNFVIGNLLGSA